MSATTVLRAIVAALDHAGIAHMLTGSFAAAYYGAGRATLDIDLVIAPTLAGIRAFTAALPADSYYVSAEAAEEAMSDESAFNVIDMVTGWKVDLIVRKSDAYHRGEFDRRARIHFEGIPLWVASVEDVILSKLVWARLGESARQMEDVVALLRARAGNLELSYIEAALDALDVRGAWDETRTRAERPS